MSNIAGFSGVYGTPTLYMPYSAGKYPGKCRLDGEQSSMTHTLSILLILRLRYTRVALSHRHRRRQVRRAGICSGSTLTKGSSERLFPFLNNSHLRFSWHTLLLTEIIYKKKMYGYWRSDLPMVYHIVYGSNGRVIINVPLCKKGKHINVCIWHLKYSTLYSILQRWFVRKDILFSKPLFCYCATYLWS